ncbi:MAG: diguanylate cyclase [Campylobacterota bacterium]|nr:diguanylate cyclase [Campylobacterota bacterium]
MKINYKLVALPLIVLVALLYISFMFSSEIDRLKKQIDNIYFGNFVPVHKLHIIKEEYKNIINDETNYIRSRDVIIENWNYYNSQYKTDKERVTVEKIDKRVLRSFKKQEKQFYDYMTKQIDLLIQYEVSSAYLQRKDFLTQYEKVSNYLFYNQLFIIFFSVVFILFIIIGTIKNNNKLEYLVNKYKSDSITDGLTGLYNRKYFDKILDDTTVVSYENNWESAFVMIDIDFFKQFNDNYGHDAGDIALKTVSNVLDTLFSQEYDYVFRLGGEEFGILIFDIDRSKLEKRLRILQNAIAAQKIKHEASKTNFLTLSMGIVLIDKNIYHMSRTDIYKLADKKLYQSKEYGRNQYTL